MHDQNTGECHKCTTPVKHQARITYYYRLALNPDWK